jgi:hypothetical protein
MRMAIRLNQADLPTCPNQALATIFRKRPILLF